MSRALAILVIVLSALIPLSVRAELFPPGPAPLAARPAAIRVTLVLPAGIELRQGSAVLSITAGDQTARIPLSEPVPPVATEGGTRHLLQPTQTGQAALAALQKRYRHGAPPASTMGMRLDLCRTVAAPRNEPFLLAIRLAPGAPVLPLVAPGAGLSAITGKAPPQIAPCP
ncbi:hypothetical protein U879_11545 [Defluviimonas sp. 20V17]|uniref:Uncharacterized protein n=1 Tax=Allgaiera indica TaxID=765699 RepID=A0AAN4UMG5_9RHOB|nr:hypothetical protein [Allgaiera indica]KDB03670.1 hypothetical protein U879_11545 [Defluviimonas sp. 20V17]GHD98200.1 hypothetical protein GCM10008024_00760 [Allgaiera indica]SDW51817.1 hypothetical protein SAMN05444006_104141 [Allgaiera indica]